MKGVQLGRSPPLRSLLNKTPSTSQQEKMSRVAPLHGPVTAPAPHPSVDELRHGECTLGVLPAKGTSLGTPELSFHFFRRKLTTDVLN